MLEIVRREPHLALRDHVADGLWGYREHGAPVRQAQLPHAGIVLIVGLGPDIEVDGAPHASFVAGLHDRPAITTHRGEQSGVQVNLTPLGARRLLGLPMGELARKTVPSSAVLGRAADELAEAIAGAADWDARLELVDRFLLRRLRDADPVRADVAYAWARLAATHGGVAIGELCRELRCSRRHLAARFGEEVGLAPKAVARILRFERATRLIRAGRGLGDVAATCGYFDQSHLTRDFRALAGCTPSAFAAAASPEEAGMRLA